MEIQADTDDLGKGFSFASISFPVAQRKQGCHVDQGSS